MRADPHSYCDADQGTVSHLALRWTVDSVNDRIVIDEASNLESLRFDPVELGLMDGSAAFEVMRDLVLHLPAMVTPRWVRAESPPIALSNLLVYLDALLR